MVKTVPSPFAPPAKVVPHRLPAASRVTPASGVEPFVPVNAASAATAPDPFAISNTVPALDAPPPADVVPYRLPDASSAKAAWELPPVVDWFSDASATIVREPAAI